MSADEPTAHNPPAASVATSKKPDSVCGRFSGKTGAHTDPIQCSVNAWFPPGRSATPTAHTSSGAAAHRADSPKEPPIGGTGFGLQPDPFQRSEYSPLPARSLYSPTIHT